jgi:hypothetical protein
MGDEMENKIGNSTDNHTNFQNYRYGLI